MAQPGVEPGSLTNRVSVLTTTLLNQTGPGCNSSYILSFVCMLEEGAEKPYDWCIAEACTILVNM